MTETQQETILAKVRLHWGIFIPVAGFAFGMVLILLPFMFFFHALMTALSRTEAPLNHAGGAPPLNLVCLLLVVLALVPLVCVLVLTWFSYAKSEITLTNRRLVFRTGFLSRRSGELPLENVESIYLSEPLLGRICGCGTVTVTSVGGSSFPLRFLGSPQSFHSTLQKAVVNAKNAVRGTPRQAPASSGTLEDDSRYMPKG